MNKNNEKYVWVNEPESLSYDTSYMNKSNFKYCLDKFSQKYLITNFLNDENLEIRAKHILSKLE